jgi:hypothetical protein
MVDLSATASVKQMEEQIQTAGHHWMRRALCEAIRRWEMQHQRCPHCSGSQVRLEGTVARTLHTQFGRIRLGQRRIRCQQCGHRWCPARHLLASLKQTRVTEPLREAAVLAGASWPYRQAAQVLHRLSGAQISAEEIRLLTSEQGQQQAQKQQREAQACCPSPSVSQETAPSTPPLAVIGMDGGWIGSREQRGGMEGKIAVIATDKQVFEPEPRPDPTSLTFYEISKRIRHGMRIEPGEPRARWKKRTYVATFASSSQLGQLAAHAAQRLDIDQSSTVIVGDGANWIKQEAQRHFAGATCILDWPHLWRVVGKAVRETASLQQRSAAWRRRNSQQISQWLWQGKGEFALEQLRSWRDCEQDQPVGKALLTALRYLEQQRSWMGNYEQWKQDGFPVGSGIIERAVALVINRRMKKRGMRWLRTNATAMVALRTSLLNTDWQQPSQARAFP